MIKIQRVIVQLFCHDILIKHKFINSNLIKIDNKCFLLNNNLNIAVKIRNNSIIAFLV